MKNIAFAQWVLLFALAGCSQAAPPSGGSSASTATTTTAETKPDCTALNKAFADHAKKIESAGEEPDLFKLYEQHGAALAKIQINDAELKPLFDTYVAHVGKANAAKVKYGAAETKAQALVDFIEETNAAAEAMLVIGVTCADKG